jgi:hypothetical protein
MQMFDGAEVSAELDARLRAAGLDPDEITAHVPALRGGCETLKSSAEADMSWT